MQVLPFEEQNAITLLLAACCLHRGAQDAGARARSGFFRPPYSFRPSAPSPPSSLSGRAPVCCGVCMGVCVCVCVWGSCSRARPFTRTRQRLVQPE